MLLSNILTTCFPLCLVPLLPLNSRFQHAQLLVLDFVHLEQANFLLWFCNHSGSIISAAAASVAPRPLPCVVRMVGSWRRGGSPRGSSPVSPQPTAQGRGQPQDGVAGGTPAKGGVSWTSGGVEERSESDQHAGAFGLVVLCYVRGRKELYH